MRYGNLVSNSSFSIQKMADSYSIVFHKHRTTIWLDDEEIEVLLKAMSSEETQKEIREALEALPPLE